MKVLRPIMLVFMAATLYAAQSIAIAEEAWTGAKTDAFPVTVVVEW